jgi:tripeptide aminopeptidase
MDGSQVGELEFENFNAAGVVVKFAGKSVHPGYAKGKMMNAVLVMQEFLNLLPKGETPQETEGYEGFYHVMDVKAGIESAEVTFIIRDHNRDLYEGRKQFVNQQVAAINSKYAAQFGKDIAEVEIKDQYFNMREKVEPVYHIVEVAEQAMKDLGIKPLIKPIRGGTDGSQLSYMGLPCPNIFAGGHNFHGKYEYVPVESIIKATEVIVRIAELVAKG